jgi:hypothetical protein
MFTQKVPAFVLMLVTDRLSQHGGFSGNGDVADNQGNRSDGFARR